MGDSRYKGPEVRMSLTYWRNSKKASVAPVGEVREERKEGRTERWTGLYINICFLFLIKKFLLFILAALGARQGTWALSWGVQGSLVDACRLSCGIWEFNSWVPGPGIEHGCPIPTSLVTLRVLSAICWTTRQVPEYVFAVLCSKHLPLWNCWMACCDSWGRKESDTTE